MAGDWMKIELELPDKPEVHAISARLNIDPDAVVGKLIRVWQWFDKHTTDGNAVGVTYALPDRISGVSGFGEAMNSVGWLDQLTSEIGGLSMPKFERHTSNSAKTRALTQKRVAKTRNAPSVTKALPEKRREDIKTSTSHPPCVRDPDKFQMHIGWNPSEEFTTLAKMAMVTVAEGKLGEFIAHWLTQPHQRTQAEWDKAFLQSAKHDALYTASTPQQSESRKPGGKFNPTAHINRGADDAKVINVN
jgi:hypothetical protein